MPARKFGRRNKKNLNVNVGGNLSWRRTKINNLVQENIKPFFLCRRQRYWFFPMITIKQITENLAEKFTVCKDDCQKFLKMENQTQ